MIDRRKFLSFAPFFFLPDARVDRSWEDQKDGLVCTPPDRWGVQQCTAGIDSRILDVVAADRQYASQWCWAACIEAVFEYYGFDVPQSQIVAETWGSIVNLPGSPAQILQGLNRDWVDRRGRRFRAQGDSFSANQVTAAQDLANDHPLIIGTLGHAMVLTALTYFRDPYGNGQVTQAIVRDPWPYSPGRRVLSSQEWYNTSFLARIRVSS